MEPASWRNMFSFDIENYVRISVHAKQYARVCRLDREQDHCKVTTYLFKPQINHND
jgi:hypothetical protein